MSKFELRVLPEICHYNSETTFNIVEMDSGEVLCNSAFKSEAEHTMLRVIKKQPEKYFTTQDIKEGYAYSLKPCGTGTSVYGVCEVCNKTVDSAYVLTEMVRYWCVLNCCESVTYSELWCRPIKFGHKKCLSGLTFKRVGLPMLGDRA